MSQTRGMFQAINPLETLYKVRNTNPNHYSVVEPLNFPRNFGFFFNNSAEDLGEKSNSNNDIKKSGNYSNNAGEFSNGYSVNHSLNNDNKYPLGSSGIYKYVIGKTFEGYVYRANGHAANYEKVASSPFYNRTTDSQVVSSYKSFEESNDADKISELRGSLDAFCKQGKLKEAVQVMGLLEQRKISIDLQLYLLMINACGKDEALKEGKYVHEHLMRSVHILDVSTNTKILDMYGKCDSMVDAWEVFNGMLERDLTSWGIMITSLAKNGFGEDALELFTEFKSNGLKPDSEMFFGVFFACSVVGDITEGLLHFESMSKDYGIVPSMKHYVSVVEMLASTGYLDEALEFIEEMPMEPSVDVWEVLMNLSRVHGQTVLGDRCAEIVAQLDHSRLDEFSKEGLIRVTDADIAKEEEREKKKLVRVNPFARGPKHYGLLRGLRQQMKVEGYVPDVTYVLHDLDPESKEDCVLNHSERLDLGWRLVRSPARSPLWLTNTVKICGDCHNALKIISKLVGREISMEDGTKRPLTFKDGKCYY